MLNPREVRGILTFKALQLVFPEVFDEIVDVAVRPLSNSIPRWSIFFFGPSQCPSRDAQCPQAGRNCWDNGMEEA